MAFRDGNETAKLKRNVLLVMAVVVLALGYFFAWVPLHKSAPVAKPDPQLMNAPAPAPSATPTKAGKNDAKATPAMVSPATGKPAAVAPDKDLKPLVNLH